MSVPGGALLAGWDIGIATHPAVRVPSPFTALLSSSPQGGDPVPEGVFFQQEDEHG